MTTDATANRPTGDNPDDNLENRPDDGSEYRLDAPLDVGVDGRADGLGGDGLGGDGLATTAHAVPSAAQEAEWAAQFDAAVSRNTVRDTWKWAWKDTTMRVLPFAVAAGVYARLSGEGADGIGITADGWRREMLLGIAVGVPLAGIAAVFRERVAPGYRLPTDADQFAQTIFYFAVNAPGEELFWRGTVQDLAVRGLARIPRLQRAAGLLGWAATTAVFGAYHRLGKWSWRSIAGVTVAGALLGALYQWPRGKRSILAPTIVHGFATAGFLSWADLYQYQRQKRRYLALMRANYISSVGNLK